MLSWILKEKLLIAEAILNRDCRLIIVPPLLKPTPQHQQIVTSRIVMGKDNKYYCHCCRMTVITESVIVIPPPYGRIRAAQDNEVPTNQSNNKLHLQTVSSSNKVC